jgi:2-haloacid dehalogenase
LADDRETIDFAAHSLKLELSSSVRDSLMQGYLALIAWPDVPDAPAELRRSGKQLARLSNVTPQIVRAGIKSSGLTGIFHHVTSRDRIRSFKPDPRTYQLGVNVLGSCSLRLPAALLQAQGESLIEVARFLGESSANGS